VYADDLFCVNDIKGSLRFVMFASIPLENQGLGLRLLRLTPLSTYFSYIVANSFIGGGNRRKPLKTRQDYYSQDFG
jgi:hypothetical protein